MKCPSCKKEKIGELQAICRYCGYVDGDDRWFSNQDENIPITLIPGH